MRRRYAIIGLLFAVAVAVFAVPIIVPAPDGRGARPVPPQARPSAAAKAEHDVKLDTIRQDMATTGMLCRIECRNDVRKLEAAGARLGAGAASKARKAAMMKEALSANRHFEAMTWRTGGASVSAGAKLGEYGQPIRRAWDEGLAAVREGRAYESASLPLHGASGYVIAVPASGKGDGIVALIHSDAVEEVEKQQRRNMRLVPYPDNSRFRTQATEPGRLKDKHVSSGDANGNASHYAVDEVVVKLKRQLTPRELLQLRKRLDLSVAREHRRQTYVFRSKTLNTAQLIAYFKKIGTPCMRNRTTFTSPTTGSRTDV